MAKTTVLTKDGATREVTSAADVVRLKWQGWVDKPAEPAHDDQSTESHE